MPVTTRSRSLSLLWILAFFVLPALACQLSSSPGVQPEEADTVSSTQVPFQEPVSGEQTTLPTQDPMAFISISSLLGSDLSEGAEVQPLEVVESWHHRSQRFPSLLGFTFVLANPNPDCGFKDINIVIRAYAENGDELGDYYESVGAVYPGQHLAVAWNISVPEEATVGRIDIEIEEGAPALPGDIAYPLTATSVTFFAEKDYILVSGQIESELENDVSSVQVVALAYDSNNRLVGGAGDVLGFIPGKGRSPVAIRLEPDQVEAVARVELLPVFSAFSELEPPSFENQNLHLSSVGVWEVSPGRYQYGLVIENLNPDRAFNSIGYRIAAYDSQGKVLAVDSNSLWLIFPGGRLPLAGNLPLPEQTQVASVDVQLNISEREEAMNAAELAQVPPFPLGTEQIEFVRGEFNYKVTGVVTSSWPKDFSYVTLIVLAFDANGAVIGDGQGSVELIPANGSQTFELSLQTMTIPAKVEVFPIIYFLSDLQ